MGINTQKKDPKYFNAIKEIDYQYIQIEFGVSNADQEQELIENLQATGMVIEAKPEGTLTIRTSSLFKIIIIMVFIIESDPEVEMQSDNISKKYSFAIRDEPGALAKALLVFNVSKSMIVRYYCRFRTIYHCVKTFTVLSIGTKG